VGSGSGLWLVFADPNPGLRRKESGDEREETQSGRDKGGIAGGA